MSLGRSALLPLALLVAACGGDAGEPDPQATATPEPPADTSPPPPPPADADADAAIGTPLEERVATIGILNKRNNVSQDIELSPGEQRRVGDVVVRLRSCERTAPWELPQETGAFVQVLVRQRGSEDAFDRIFSGWLFLNSPGLNVVEHPIYDVFVKDCAMDFPGETDA